ncbi:FIG00554508: hypothetical protein [Cronobacter muytjensii 530]
MRELCANTIYKFVNRFSFVAPAGLAPEFIKRKVLEVFCL